jgi:hypothetical protein
MKSSARAANLTTSVSVIVRDGAAYVSPISIFSR